MIALILRGVGSAIGKIAALTGIDPTAAAGTRTAIVGLSPSGKSTLLRLIAGFEAPDEREILLDGRVAARPVVRAWALTSLQTTPDSDIHPTVPLEQRAPGAPTAGSLLQVELVGEVHVLRGSTG